MKVLADLACKINEIHKPPYHVQNCSNNQRKCSFLIVRVTGTWVYEFAWVAVYMWVYMYVFACVAVYNNIIHSDTRNAEQTHIDPRTCGPCIIIFPSTFFFLIFNIYYPR